MFQVMGKEVGKRKALKIKEKEQEIINGHSSYARGDRKNGIKSAIGKMSLE